MTRQDMRDYVRLYLDADEEDLPDTLLDVWLDEGTSRVQRTFEPWSFYKTTWVGSTSSGSIAFDELGDGTDPTAESLVTVYDDDLGCVLAFLPYDAALRKFSLLDTATGVPYAYSIAEDTLFFWPTPTDTFNYRVNGYRAPVPAVDSTDVIDLPVEFHPLVSEWVLARAYEQQDDEIMSTQKFGRFEQQLDAFKRRYTRGQTAGIQAIGQVPTTEMPWVPSRLRYDWEF